ncbi:uncharacterized protein CTRU02_207364 [Colletotrichum truncatum]|uniref:Uncharacterized protein n=1 Tax=Colletotrichum truncatum TaxID=5467 RepID=A0ACC3Z0L5_COLTU|nr:uncharacterized protein CTRU02_01001 [Colletotrichum truncatum]KAF6800596.1 hypothetical protein CTRU02_01001 [Colletotrichum truncatum]
MSSTETQYLKAILRDATTSTMSGNYYESAMVIPGMHASAMPRRPTQPAQASRSNAAAMASEVTLVDKDGVPVLSKEKTDADSVAKESSPSRKGFLKRILKKA